MSAQPHWMSVIETGGGVKVTCFKYRQYHDNMPDLTNKPDLRITCDVSSLSWVFKYKTMSLFRQWSPEGDKQ